jgi:hypothetical protein
VKRGENDLKEYRGKKNTNLGQGYVGVILYNNRALNILSFIDKYKFIGYLV